MNASPQLSPQALPFQKPHFSTAIRDASVTEHEAADGGGFRNSLATMKQIAALSTERILELKRSELIDAIRSVRASHLRPGVLERLPQMDGDTLRRLVFLTRRYCRNRLLLAETTRCPNTFAVYCS
jgi:hypothetical protein